jgi:hypothetical protein
MRVSHTLEVIFKAIVLVCLLTLGYIGWILYYFAR